MATYLENLTTRRDAIAAELAALTSTAAGGKPNSEAGGIDHQGYKEGLMAELKALNEAIDAAQAFSDGAWEELTPCIT